MTPGPLIIAKPPTPYYQSERVTLYCGDCLSVLPTIRTGSVGAIITDPPYSSGGAFRGDRMVSTRGKYQSSDIQVEHPSFEGDNRDQRGWAYWCAMWLAECRRVSEPGAALCMFTDWRQLPTATDVVQAGGWVWRGLVPWDKVVARPQADRFRAQAEYIIWATNGARPSAPSATSVYLDGIFRVTTPPTADREHSTQKPIELLQQIMPICRAGGTVFEPFAGSGTTAVAAIQSGRNVIACEISEEYCEIAARRCKEAEQSSSLYSDPKPETQAEMFAGVAK